MQAHNTNPRYCRHPSAPWWVERCRNCGSRGAGRSDGSRPSKVGWPKKRLYRPSGHAVDLPRQALDSDADLWLPPKGHQQARFGGCDLSKRVTDPNDGLIVDIVGAWAAEKHERLRKYIDAAHGARAKYLRPRGSGGAAYVELFSGPGRSFVDDDKAFIDGSPLVPTRPRRKAERIFPNCTSTISIPQTSRRLAIELRSWAALPASTTRLPRRLSTKLSTP